MKYFNNKNNHCITMLSVAIKMNDFSTDGIAWLQLEVY